MIARPLSALPRAFRRDAGGTVSVEFALLLPVLLTLFFGCYEASNLMLAYLKVDDATQTVADLLAQTQLGYALQDGTGTETTNDFTNFNGAATAVMAPLPTTNLAVAYASVTWSSGSPVIDWHYETGGATPIALGSVPADLGIADSTDSVVVVSIQYTYTSPISYVLSKTYTISDTAYDRPRYATCVPAAFTAGNKGLCSSPTSPTS